MPFKSLSIRADILEKIRKICAKRNAENPTEKPLTVGVWANTKLEEAAEKELKNGKTDRIDNQTTPE